MEGRSGRTRRVVIATVLTLAIVGMDVAIFVFAPEGLGWGAGLWFVWLSVVPLVPAVVYIGCGARWPRRPYRAVNILLSVLLVGPVDRDEEPDHLPGWVFPVAILAAVLVVVGVLVAGLVLSG